MVIPAVLFQDADSTLGRQTFSPLRSPCGPKLSGMAQIWSHFEAGTEFTVGVEPADPLVSVVREEPFAVRLGQLSTRYVSRRPAQEN